MSSGDFESATDRLNAALSGRYRFLRELGEGGMATVYLAEDLKHSRRVALKVLKPELAAVVGAERFLAEIETTASLTHPHILPLHDSGEARVEEGENTGSILYYVMPYVEEGTLRDRLDREGQLGFAEAIEISRKVASALEYAHRQGVVHRDVKPGNILLSGGGEPAVADFGVALAVTEAGGARLTETGIIIGTAQYMSPEQASGAIDLDARTDVYSLGCVLYEMLAGSPPFTGPTPQAITARKLSEPPPDLTAARRSAPRDLAAVVDRSLASLPADRYSSAGRFADELNRATRNPISRGVRDRAGRSRASALIFGRMPVKSIATAGFVLLMAAFAAWGWLRRVGERGGEAIRMELSLPPGVNVTRNVAAGSSLAVSPDGRTVVIVGTDDEGRRLYRRPLDRLDAEPIPGTEGGGSPFFSPDGEWIGFFSEGRLRKVPLTGGTPIDIASAPGVPMGASWASDERIVYGWGYRSPLFVVSADGGEAQALTDLDIGAGELSHRHPEFLPGGRVLLFANFGAAVTIDALDTASGEKTRVTQGVAPRFTNGGYLLLSRGTTLFGAPMDPAEASLEGPLVPLVERVTNELQFAAVHYDVSPEGNLVYVPGSEESGLMVGRPDSVMPITVGGGPVRRPRFSPDGRRLAVRSGSDIWIYDVEQEDASRFTFEGGDAPIWNADGSAITFGRRGEGVLVRRRDGEGGSQRVLASDRWVQPVGWTPDGDRLAVTIDFLEMEGGCIAVVEAGEYRCLIEELVGWWSRLSPDGRWLVYQTEETGRPEIYATRFPDGGRRWQISREGGSGPAWGPDGLEVFYRSGSRLVAARVDSIGGLRVESRRTVMDPFQLRRPDDYDIHPDGRTMALVRPIVASEQVDAVAVLDWSSELERRVRR